MAVALLAAAATQCNLNCPADPPPADYWTDGGARDVGEAESARDAGPEGGAARDAGTARDAGPAAWIPLPGIADRCNTRMALDPGAVQRPLRFEPCPDRAGCRQIVADWAPNRYGARIIMFEDTGYHDGERGLFVFGRPDPRTSDPRWWWIIIATDVGEILAVFRDVVLEGGCFLFKLALGEGRFAVEIAMGDYSSRILGGDLSAPVATIHEVAYFDPRVLGDGWISFLRVGAEQIAVSTIAYHGFRVGWDGSIRRIDHHDGTPVDVEAPSVVGRAIVFDSWEARNGVLVSEGGAPPADLVVPPAPGAEPSVHDRTDGRTLAWLTGLDRVGGSALHFARVDLWASPFAPRASDLRPVRLATMRNPWAHSGVIGGWGHAAVVDDDAAVIRFFRVSDGHETLLRAPDGLAWSGWVGFIGPREALASAGTMHAYTGQTAVQFIDYRALEPAR